MHILLLSPYYPPDLAPDASLFEMLCTDLKSAGYEVSVLCAVPHYPTGRVPEQFRGRPIQREVKDGVDVTRVWLPSVNRANLLQRMVVVLCYQVLATIAGLRRKYDVIITVNPSFEKALPILLLSVLRRKQMIFCVYDIYPDVGIRLGIFRHRAIIKIVAAMEEFCCRHARVVQVLSEGHRQTLVARGVPDQKVAVVPPWVDTDFIRPLPRENAFSDEHGLNECFSVVYAGNFGLTQGLEQLVETAKYLQQQPEIRLVLIGKGDVKAALEQAFRRAGLKNVQFIASQPREKLPYLLASADVHLVMLKKGFGGDSVPSKTYSIMASARPILAVVDDGSDTWQLVEKVCCGLCAAPGDPRALADAIMHLHSNPSLCAQMGAKARTYALDWHSRQNAVREYDRLLTLMNRLHDGPLPNGLEQPNPMASETVSSWERHDS